MNTTSTVRLLRTVAVALGVAILGLGAVWLLQERALPASAAGEPEARSTAVERPDVMEAVDPGRSFDTEHAADPSLRPPAAEAAPDVRALLYGSLRDADGEPVRDGVMWIFRDHEHVGTHGLQKGTFAFPGLRPGVHRVRARIPDERPFEREITVHAPRTRVDLQLPPRWRLIVHAVTPDGQPLIEALTKRFSDHRWANALSVIATPEPLDGDLSPCRSSKVAAGLGAFRENGQHTPWRHVSVLPASAVGMLTLPPDRAVHVALLTRNAVLAQGEAAPGRSDLEFVVPLESVEAKLARVRLRLIDEQGAPVAGVRVAMTDAQSWNAGQPTDESGRVVFESLRPGRLDLTIQHHTLAGPPVLIDVPSGADLDLGDIVLRPYADVELDVSAFEGSGSVRVFSLDAPAREGWNVHDFSVSAEDAPPVTVGPTRQLRLFPGRYTMVGRSKRRVAIVHVDTRALGSAPVRFPLTEGVPLRVRGHVGDLPVHLGIRSPVSGLVYCTDLNGAVDLRIDLPAGDYVAQIGAGPRPVERSLTLGPAGAVLEVP